MAPKSFHCLLMEDLLLSQPLLGGVDTPAARIAAITPLLPPQNSYRDAAALDCSKTGATGAALLPEALLAAAPLQALH